MSFVNSKQLFPEYRKNSPFKLSSYTQLETTATQLENINKETENFVVSEKILQQLNVTRGHLTEDWLVMLIYDAPLKRYFKENPPYEFLQWNLHRSSLCVHIKLQPILYFMAYLEYIIAVRC